MDVLELGKKPISEDKPAGIDVRYEPEFETLQTEIDKLSIASSEGGGIDWKKVVELSETILAEKSKNIQVAAYLAVALTTTQGLDGLMLGMNVLKDLVENFWDTMYPPKKRMRGRINSLAWWLDSTEAFFKSFDPSPMPEEKVNELTEGIDAFDSVLSEKSEDAPVIHRLMEYARRIPIEPKEEPAAPEEPAPAEAEAAEADTGEAETPAAEEKAPTKPAPSTPKDKTAPAPSVAIDSIKTASDADKSVESALAILSGASDAYLQDDAANPQAYRLLRLASWMPVDRLPLAEDHQTPLPPPDSTIMSSLESLMSAKDYEAAIRSAEARVPQFLFWLDLSRVTAQALDELGGKYQAALDAVNMETAAYVHRLEGLEDLTFSDGTPFADKETKAWLKSIALNIGQAPVMTGGDETQAVVSEAMAKAEALAKDHKTVEAMQLMEQGLAASGGGKNRLIWRMSLARLLMDLAHPELARPHLDEILKQIREHSLELWDPDLAIGALSTVYSGLEDSEEEEDQQLAGEVLSRIRLLSPARAVNLIK